MNYLAHLLLADDTDASRIGNLLGDFTRGAMDDLAKIYPPEVIRGIRMHRAVDRFTDSHAAFKEARALLAPERRRFAGIIVDIIFDHYLSIHWKNYCDQPLEDFVQEIYRALDEHPEWRAGRLAEGYPWMKTDNLLMRYSTVEGIGLTLERVSRRRPRLEKIAEGIHDLQGNYDAFEKHFSTFMPDLLEFVTQWKKEN